MYSVHVVSDEPLLPLLDLVFVVVVLVLTLIAVLVLVLVVFVCLFVPSLIIVSSLSQGRA